MAIISFITIVIVSMIIVLFSLWVAHKVASVVALKASANKSNTTVVVRRWTFWGVTSYVTSPKEIWHNVAYSATFNIMFRVVMWSVTAGLNLLVGSAKRTRVGAY